jgi:hypothetical protein
VNKPKSRSRTLALKLAANFFEKGYFDVVNTSIKPATSPTSANDSPDIEEYYGGFAGLSIQGVGCATGNQEQIYIYVNNGDKRKLDRISDNIEGIPVKTIKIGKPIVKPENVVKANQRGNVFIHQGRIACGSSCQPAGENYVGTFGAIVQQNNERFALSNNHVFAACNHTPVGQPIMSPSSGDTGPNVPPPRLIARHAQILELRSGNPDLVPLTSLDAAVAIIEPNNVTSWQGAEDGYDTPNQCTSSHAGMLVKKIGRTTGLQHGTIESEIPGQWCLEYKSKKFTATVWFQEIWTVKANDMGCFALSGDSGSLVVTEDEEYAVGLLFAANPKGDYGFIFPIEKILQQFNMTLVNQYGL